MSEAVDIWLEALGCGQYRSVFESRGFWSVQLLSNIEAKVLDDMGIAEKDKQKILQALKQGSGNGVTSEKVGEPVETNKEPLMNGTSCIRKNPQANEESPTKAPPVSSNDNTGKSPVGQAKEGPVGQGKENLASSVGQGKENVTCSVVQGKENLASPVGQGKENLASPVGQGKENLASPVGQGKENMAAEGKENIGDTQRNVCTGKRDPKICDKDMKTESISRFRIPSCDKEEETVENINAYLQELVNGPSDTSLDDTSPSPKKGHEASSRFTQPSVVSSKRDSISKDDKKDGSKADKIQRSSSTSSRDSLENAMTLLMGSPDNSKTSNLTPEVHKPPRKKFKTNDGTAAATKRRGKKDDSEPVKRKVKKNEGKLPKGRQEQGKPPPEQPDRYKGPYVHIDGMLQQPKSVSVINAQVKEVVETKEKAQKKKSNTSQTKDFQTRAGKIGFRSAMAMNYDALTVDASWVCVFCQLGSHASGLGDLFGPYFVKKGAAAATISNVTLKEQPEKTESKEVWFHSACFIWAPSVHMISSQLRGLDDLVNITEETKCGGCGKLGASLSCVTPSCRSFWHYPCAIQSKQVQLDSEKLHLNCPRHAIPK